MPSMLAAFCLLPPVRSNVRSMTNFSMSSRVMLGGTSQDIAGAVAFVLTVPLSIGAGVWAAVRAGRPPMHLREKAGGIHER